MKQRPAIDGSEASTIQANRSLWDRYFWAFACGVILISIFTRAFDYSLVPLSYKGVFVTRPYCGLHSDAVAGAAWAARCHVEYGLSYTKGYRTLALGDPPPAQPQRDVSHLPAETWITALGMKLLGTHDWSVPLLDAILSIPALALAMFQLRRLYGSGCARTSIGERFIPAPLAILMAGEPPPLPLRWRILHSWHRRGNRRIVGRTSPRTACSFRAATSI